MFREAKHKKSLNQMLKKLNKAKHLLCNEEGAEGGEWTSEELPGLWLTSKDPNIHSHTCTAHTRAHNRMPRWIVGRGIDSCKP